MLSILCKWNLSIICNMAFNILAGAAVKKWVNPYKTSAYSSFLLSGLLIESLLYVLVFRGLKPLATAENLVNYRGTELLWNVCKSIFFARVHSMLGKLVFLFPRRSSNLRVGTSNRSGQRGFNRVNNSPPPFRFVILSSLEANLLSL